MNASPALKGYLCALFTVLVWGTTFVSTKVLLEDFAPIEILFVRFLLGLAALWAIHPHLMPLKKRSHELLFAACGLSGVVIYYLLETVALEYANASNVSLIVSCAPLFVGLFTHLLGWEKVVTPAFVGGFVLCAGGIALITFTDQASVSFGSLGDLISVGAAAGWGVYSVVMKLINDHGYAVIPTTRRIFMWALVFMAPLLPIMGATPDFARFVEPVNLANLLFLGLIASAACFVTWNKALELLGGTKASPFLYLCPVITVIASVPILGEPLTFAIVVGTALVLGGLALSEWKKRPEQA